MGRKMAKIEWSDKAPQAHTRSEFIITDGTMVKFVSNYDTTLSLSCFPCMSLDCLVEMVELLMARN